MGGVRRSAPRSRRAPALDRAGSVALCLGMLVLVGLLAALALGSDPAKGRPMARPAALPPPRFGRTLDIGLVSGTVIVSPPHRRSFKLGVRDRSIPIASLIDTAHGRVDLRAAPPRNSPRRVEDSEFFGGAFRVRQPRGALTTSVTLAKGRFAVCTVPPSGRAAAARRPPHRLMRLLHASGNGNFRMRGRYIAATELGTVWSILDFCDGTLVRVKRGKVSVDDLVRRRIVLVSAGHSYFAPAP